MPTSIDFDGYIRKFEYSPPPRSVADGCGKNFNPAGSICRAVGTALPAATVSARDDTLRAPRHQLGMVKVPVKKRPSAGAATRDSAASIADATEVDGRGADPGCRFLRAASAGWRRQRTAYRSDRRSGTRAGCAQPQWVAGADPRRPTVALFAPTAPAAASSNVDQRGVGRHPAGCGQVYFMLHTGVSSAITAAKLGRANMRPRKATRPGQRVASGATRT